MTEIKPQPGPQEAFLATPADIGIYGGAAYGGKTYALLMEPLRHIGVQGFGGTIFRRTSPQITNEGGLWDTSSTLYPHAGGTPTSHPIYRWRFGTTSKIEFHHLQYDKNIHDWQGSQIPLIGYDELTHFTEKQFFYLLSRNRSMCGIAPYIRATTNPDPDTWVKKFIRWWLDEDGEYADPAKAGVLRWMIRSSDDIEWFDTRAEAIDYAGGIGKPELQPKSVTFIPSSIYDNKIGLEADPGYLANLMALPRVERLRLLKGNWKVRATAGTIFSRDDFEIVDAAPVADRECRCWDRAATEPNPENTDPDWTAGVKMQRTGDTFFITDVSRLRRKPNAVKKSIKNTASRDGSECVVVLFQDPAQAGKVEIHDYLVLLAGYSIETTRETGKKYLRWRPLAAQAQAGNVKLVEGDWNEPFINELENLSEDDSEYAHDDQADAASGAFNYLTMALQWVPV